MGYNNMVDICRLYSDRAGRIRKSVIRELLKVTQDLEIISFSGGLLNPKSFPLKDLEGVTRSVLERRGETALQYETTEELGELRKAIAERAYKDGIETIPDDVIIMSGSQQALDAVAWYNFFKVSCTLLPRSNSMVSFTSVLILSIYQNLYLWGHCS